MAADPQQTGPSVSEIICEYWIIKSKIPLQQAHSMRQELEDHFAEALRDGKSVEDVVGEDTLQFADAWAESSTKNSSIGTWLVVTSVAFVPTPLFELVVQRTAKVQVPIASWFLLGLLVCLGSVFLLESTVPRLSNAGIAAAPWKRPAAFLVGFLAILFGLVVVIDLLEMDRYQITLPWWSIVLSCLVSIGLLISLRETKEPSNT